MATIIYEIIVVKINENRKWNCLCGLLFCLRIKIYAKETRFTGPMESHEYLSS